jgi:hypothetical protein
MLTVLSLHQGGEDQKLRPLENQFAEHRSHDVDDEKVRQKGFIKRADCLTMDGMGLLLRCPV